MPKISRDEAQEVFDAQVAELSRSGVHIKAYVFNTALR